MHQVCARAGAGQLQLELRECLAQFLYGQPQFLQHCGVRTGETAFSSHDHRCAIFYISSPSDRFLRRTAHAARQASNRTVIEAHQSADRMGTAGGTASARDAAVCRRPGR
jgi:hypothetical protein